MPLAQRLIETLPSGLDNLFNPWVDHCEHESLEDGPEARLARLANHLNCNPRFILIGEAPGYKGCRYSGIAFTSESQLLREEIPRVPAVGHRLTTRQTPFSEPSATIVWRALNRNNTSECTVLWNALQLHPHHEDPWSNRTPTTGEIALGVASLRILKNAFPKARIVAVGKKAGNLLRKMGIEAEATLRHPANRGAAEFDAGIDQLMGNPALKR